MGTVIDLPISPLRSTTAEGSLRDAPVIASLMDGKTIAGRLVTLDGPQRMVVLHRKGLGRTYQIKFSQLRALSFVTRYPINRARHPVQDQAIQTFMPRASQEFRIVFIDQKALAGRTRGSFVDDIGIHLFQLVDDSHISRLFIPAQVVRKYYIGERKPKDVPHRAASPAPQAPAAKDKAAPTPKRRKSDRGAHKVMATSAAQLEQALDHPSGGSLTGPKRIGEMLVEEDIITREQLEAALQAQEREPGLKLGEILVRMGTVAADQIYAALAHKFGLPFVLLRDFFVDIECLKLVPADVARKYTLVPLLVHKDRLVVAMDDPANSEAVTVLRFITQYRVEPTIATRDDLQWAISKYYGGTGAARSEARGASESVPTAEGEREVMDKAVTSFVNNTILDAIKRDASDVHIVAKPDYAEMLFRIKGTLMPVRRFNRVLLPGVMKRLRTMSRLRDTPGERQQGKACILSGDDIIGLHIVLEQNAQNETAVIRILDTMMQLKRVRDLGLNTGDAQRLSELLNRSYSLVVVSGPRGSGKSRTLYAALATARESNLEVATVEAPVKFYVNGFNQWQAGENGDEGFRRAFDEARASEPDVLMIGILNDRRMLSMAMEAALGGCLVLSKLHSASAATAVVDMMLMDRGHRMLNSTLAGVLAQHLVHLNCKFCMREESVDPAVRREMGVADDEVFYSGRGCNQCNHTGYSGEHVVFELLSVTPDMHALIRGGAQVHAIYRQAVSDGMTPAAESALMLARSRRISLAEAHRLLQRTRID